MYTACMSVMYVMYEWSGCLLVLPLFFLTFSSTLIQLFYLSQTLPLITSHTHHCTYFMSFLLMCTSHKLFDLFYTIFFVQYALLYASCSVLTFHKHVFIPLTLLYPSHSVLHFSCLSFYFNISLFFISLYLMTTVIRGLFTLTHFEYPCISVCSKSCFVASNEYLYIVSALRLFTVCLLTQHNAFGQLWDVICVCILQIVWGFLQNSSVLLFSKRHSLMMGRMGLGWGGVLTALLCISMIQGHYPSHLYLLIWQWQGQKC